MTTATIPAIATETPLKIKRDYKLGFGKETWRYAGIETRGKDSKHLFVRKLSQDCIVEIEILDANLRRTPEKVLDAAREYNGTYYYSSRGKHPSSPRTFDALALLLEGGSS
jgi:hypothetical protein